MSLYTLVVEMHAPMSQGSYIGRRWEGSSFLFHVRGKGPKSEAQRVDSGVGVLGEVAAGPSTPATGSRRAPPGLWQLKGFLAF